METLNMIADDIAYKLGNPFDTVLKESIRRTVKHWRVTLIRQDMLRNKRIFEDYLTSATFTLQKVDLVKELGVEICCGLIAPELESDREPEYLAYKVMGEVPKVIRNRVNTKDGFSFVGNALRTERFLYTKLHLYQRDKLLPLSGNRTFYIHVNNNYYVLPNNTNDSFCDIVFEGVLENPELYYDDCEDVLINDREFKIPGDMLTIIKDSIVKGTYPLMNVDSKFIEVKPSSAPMTMNPVGGGEYNPEANDNN